MTNVLWRVSNIRRYYLRLHMLSHCTSPFYFTLLQLRKNLAYLFLFVNGKRTSVKIFGTKIQYFAKYRVVLGWKWFLFDRQLVPVPIFVMSRHRVRLIRHKTLLNEYIRKEYNILRSFAITTIRKLLLTSLAGSLFHVLNIRRTIYASQTNMQT